MRGMENRSGNHDGVEAKPKSRQFFREAKGMAMATRANREVVARRGLQLDTSYGEEIFHCLG